MLHVLTITNILPPGVDRWHLPNYLDCDFFRNEPNFRWVYCVSRDINLLESFKLKILSFTPGEFIPWMPIEIFPLENLSSEEITDNHLDRVFYRDLFYICGTVNENRRDRYTLEEFLPEHWNQQFTQIQ